MSFTYTPQDLFAGDFPVKTDVATLLSGAGSLVRGTVLGKITLGAVTSAAGTNTGDGTLTPDATTPKLANAQVGAYSVVCTTAHNDVGPVLAVFTVRDPSGAILGTVAEGAAFANQIKFAVAAGTADFVLADSFVVTVAAGSGKYTTALLAAVDGSATPVAILADAYDATSADKSIIIYKTGSFNVDALTFGTGTTAANAKDALEARNIYLVTCTVRS